MAASQRKIMRDMEVKAMTLKKNGLRPVWGHLAGAFHKLLKVSDAETLR